MEAPEADCHVVEQPFNQSPFGNGEEEYLRLTWGKLGVGKDGYLDQGQLALVCECIGMEKLSDDVIAQLFDKLDLDRDGRISFGEFLHLFRNVRPGKGEACLESDTYEPDTWDCGSRNNRSSVRPEILVPSQSTMALFASIDPAGTGFATYDGTVECLRSLGVSQASHLLEALSFRHQRINLRDLVAALQEEMSAGLDSGLLTNLGPSGAALHAGLLLMQHELAAVRLAAEHAGRECEKLRSDLQEANQRSALLAQEVDENHAKQETIRRTQFKQLEQRHADQLRLVQEVAQAEREQQVSQLHGELDKRQLQLGQAKEEEARLKEALNAMTEDNARLTAENANLTEKLASSERANGRLIQELDGVSLMAELESRCEALEESQRHSLTEQLSRLSAENLQLRDRTDELSAEIEMLRGQLATARCELAAATNGPGFGWRSEPSVSGAVKRRNAGPDASDDEDPARDATDGKLRKRDAPRRLHSPEESPQAPPHDAHRNGWKEELSPSDQSLAAQLELVKPSDSSPGTGVIGSLKRVFEKLKLQYLEEFLEGHDKLAILQERYRSELSARERAHADEKRSLSESHLLRLSGAEARLDEALIRIDDLVQLQRVMEAEHEMELNDLRERLKRAESRPEDRGAALTSQDEEFTSPELASLVQLLRENLTEALADLDAALEKELSRDVIDDDDSDNETSPSKVQELEKQCKTLESELDSVKVEIVKILRDNEELRHRVRRQQEELETEQKEADLRMEEKVEYETALLQQRIKQLVRETEDEKQKHEQEKSALEEDRKDLESRLEMLRNEFERLDDYWQTKLDEERELYDAERESTDERFRELEAKIKEYEELLANSDNQSTSSLSTIEERSQWEKQLNDLEEEVQQQSKEIVDLKMQLERALHDRAMETARVEEEKERLEEELGVAKAKLEDCKEREEKLNARIDALLSNPPQIRSPVSNCSRPASPIPKQGPLPPGYSPLKTKPWSKPQRPYASLSPSKSVESAIDGADFRSVPLTRSPSFNSGCSEAQRVCRVDISVFQSLNARVKQQEQRCRELQFALHAQKQRTEKILKEIKYQHQEEIASLELMMKASQETMRQMSLKHQQTLDKLAASDVLVVELYTENQQLVQALHLQSAAHRSAPSL